MSDITLTATQRATLLSLQQVTDLQARTQTRLNTGKKVNSASDDAVAYFKAQALTQRSNDFNTYKSNIDQSVQTVNSALTATSSVESLLNQLKAVLSNVSGNTASQNVAATSEFKDLSKQLYQLVKESTYQGLNILSGSSTVLTTQVSDRTASTFVITGYNLISTGAGNSLSLFTGASNVFSSAGTLSFSAIVSGTSYGAITSFTALNASGFSASNTQQILANTEKVVSNAISQVQGITAALGTNVNILQDRSSFASNYSSVLQTGSDKLTLADLNTEAANSTALSLRQQLGIQSLTTSATQNSSVLSLLRTA